MVILLLFLPSCYVFVGEPARADGSLAWKFQRGQALHFRIRRSATTAVEATAGIEVPNDPAPSLDATLTWSVENVDAQGTADVRLTLEHIHEEMNERSRGGDRMVYDSDDPKSVDNPWSGLKAALYRPLIGAPYRLKVDRRGGILSISLPKGAREVWRKFSIQPRDDRDYLFTEGGMRSLFSAVPEFPDRPVAQGDTWRHRRQVKKGALRRTLVETYSLTTRERQLVTFVAKPQTTVEVIRNSARNEAKPGSSKSTLAPIDAKVEEQSGESKLTFDLDAGRLVNFSRQHRYKVKYAYGAEAGAGTTQTITLATAIEFEVRAIAVPGGR